MQGLVPDRIGFMFFYRVYDMADDRVYFKFYDRGYCRVYYRVF